MYSQNKRIVIYSYQIPPPPPPPVIFLSAKLFECLNRCLTSIHVVSNMIAGPIRICRFDCFIDLPY